MFKKFIIATALCLILASCAQAEPIKIGDVFNKFPVKEGYFYDWKDGKGYNVLGLELAQYKGFSVNAAYVGMEGAGMTLDYSLSNLPVENVPVLKLVEYLSVGYGAAIQQITLTNVDENPSEDNKLIHGTVLYCKIKF